VVDKTYQNTMIVGVSAKIDFPNERLNTLTYHETGWRAASSVFIESSSYDNLMASGICIDTHLAKVLGSSYASGTITSEVFDRLTTDTWTPHWYILSGSDSMSSLTAQSTITYQARTDTESPLNSDWSTIETNTTYYDDNQYLQWRAVLTTSNTNTINPYILRMNLESGGYYTCGFKIYHMYVSRDNQNDTSYFDIDSGPNEENIFMDYGRAGTSYPIDYMTHPIICPETCTFYIYTGTRVRVEFTED